MSKSESLAAMRRSQTYLLDQLHHELLELYMRIPFDTDEHKILVRAFAALNELV